MHTCHEESPSGGGSRAEQLTALLRRCSRILYHHSEPGMQQLAVLRLLTAGNATPRQVQESLGIRPGSASELITKLENKGFLTRRRTDADRRSVELSLTERGAEFVRRHVDCSAAAMLDVLSAEEQQELAALLEKLLHTWVESGVIHGR